MSFRLGSALVLAAIAMIIGASNAAASTDFTVPCTTTDTACLAERLTAVEAWIEANDTDVPVPTPKPSPTTAPKPTASPTAKPSPTTTPTPKPTATPTPKQTAWEGSISHGPATGGKVTPLTVTMTSPSGPQTNKVIYVEAWQNGALKADVFLEHQNLTGRTTRTLDLPALAPGNYELRLKLFSGPPAGGSYEWGEMRLHTEAQKLTVAAPVTPAGPVNPVTPKPPITGVLYDGPKQVDQFPGYEILKSTPTARWYAGGTPAEVQDHAREWVTAANGNIATLLVYNVPKLNADTHTGGAADLAEYRTWIDGLAAGIGTAPVIVSVEPDALGLLGGLPEAHQTERIESIKYAVQKLKANPNARVYVDAADWVDATEMANRVKRVIPAGMSIDGISVNVSAYNSNASVIDYGNKVIAASGLPWKMIVDTSRNGVATASTWCNPFGQGLGKLPTLTPGVPNVDAFLWLKAPGESDGTCNGGPDAGAFFHEHAQELIRNARL